MRKTLPLKKEYIIDLVALLAIVGYFYILLSLIHPARHVDPDFFQFLNDSTYYLTGKLPPFIQSLPANPFLIGFFSQFTNGKITEIEVALLLNALFSTAAVGLLYFVTKKTTGSIYALLLSIFLITHPVIFHSAISNNTEILFSLFLVIILWLVSFGYKSILYFISAIAVLIRYEALLLFPTFLSYDLLLKSNYKKVFLDSLLFIIPAICLLSILLLQNTSQTVVGTPFLQEVIDRQDDLPELRFFTNLSFVLVPFIKDYFYPILGYIMSITVLSLMVILTIMTASRTYLFKTDKFRVVLVCLLFTFAYLLFHMLFPAYLERYMVPIIFLLSYTFISVITYFQKIKVKSVVLAGILFIILVNSMALFSEYMLQQSLASSDFFIPLSISKIIESNKKYLVVTPYPETQIYYFKNLDNVELISVVDLKNRTNCYDLSCAFDSLETVEALVPYSGYFEWGLTGNYDNSLRRWYEDIGLYELGEYLNSELCEIHTENFSPYYVSITIYSTCLDEDL